MKAKDWRLPEAPKLSARGRSLQMALSQASDANPLPRWSFAPKEAGWHSLLRLDNIGPKTITELMRLGLLERHPSKELYRLSAAGGEDFGDLWVA